MVRGPTERRVVEGWGYTIIRGSTSRGGAVALREIVRTLRRGQPVALTPDGPRGPRQKMKPGPLIAARMAGVPIIPIAVVGAEESMPTITRLPAVAKALGLPYFPITANMAFGPLGALTPFPAKMKFKVLDAVTFDDVEPDQPRYSRSRIMEESEAIRQQIQEALFDMLRRRRSVWFG